MRMSKLKLGKMTGQEIAEWLGISYNGTYRKCPKKYIQKLDEYCEYEQIRGGIVIKEIYIEEYNKNLKINTDKLYIKELEECNYLASVSGIAEKYHMSKHTVRKSRDRLFGETPVNISITAEAKGLIGSREYIWCIKLQGENNYRKMTEEEDKLFDILISQVYGSLDPKDIKAQQLILQSCIELNLSAA
jgi:hypothetical protein